MSTKRRPRVLFISHSASRNGATILLLSFLRWLKDRVDWDIEVLVHGRGPLLDEFREIAKTTVWRDPAPALDALFRHSNGRFCRFVEHAFQHLLLPARTYDLVYANTIAAAPSVMHLVGQAKAILWHIHELAYAMRLSLPEDALRTALRLPTRVVAASQAVQRMLCEEFGILPDKIDVVHSFTPLCAAQPDEHQVLRQQVRSELNWPREAFVIGGCGSLGWRKGSDLFLQIANSVKSSCGARDIRFLWVGGHPSTRDWLEFIYDLAALRLGDICSVVPVTANVSAYYCAMDAFALTSREEPLGLVALDAAEYGLPVVCFQGGGGAEEFVADDAGIRIPYLDVGAFSKTLVRLCDDPGLRSRMGKVGRMRVSESYRVGVQAPKLLASIRQCMHQTTDTKQFSAGTGLTTGSPEPAQSDRERSS